MEASENFSIYYHPNSHTRLFLLAFQSLEQAVGLIQRSHDGFINVSNSDISYPCLTIDETNTDKKTEMFFCRK
jgi:hypothetical protein